MKTSGSGFVHLKGDVAYMIYWESVYKFRTRLSEVKSKDLNLEIIVTEKGDMHAYRHDGPSDMNIDMRNVNGWNLFNEESLTPYQEDDLFKMIDGLNLNRLKNKQSDQTDQIIPG